MTKLVKRIVYYIKGFLFGADISTYSNVVEDDDFLSVELAEVEASLVGLLHRLHDGKVELESTIKDSEEIIKRHQEILQKARDKRSEYQGKSQRVEDLLTAVGKLDNNNNN